MTVLPLLNGIDPTQKLPALLGELSGWSYGLGYKIVPIDLQGHSLIGTGPDGDKATKVDCSGFVRWAIYHMTAGVVDLPDGSVIQHSWFDDHGYTKQDPSVGHDTDGALRIAFLRPSSTVDGIGHVLLIIDGMTYESHGGVGPSQRDWGCCPFMHEMELYQLTEGK